MLLKLILVKLTSTNNLKIRNIQDIMKQVRNLRAERRTKLKNKTKNGINKLIFFVTNKINDFKIRVIESYQSNKIKLLITIGFFLLISVGTYNMEDIVKYSKRKQVEQIQLTKTAIPSELRFTTPFDEEKQKTKKVGLNAELSKNFR